MINYRCLTISDLPPPLEFNVDRPFIYSIVKTNLNNEGENSIAINLFVGSITEPPTV